MTPPFFSPNSLMPKRSLRSKTLSEIEMLMVYYHLVPHGHLGSTLFAIYSSYYCLLSQHRYLLSERKYIKSTAYTDTVAYILRLPETRFRKFFRVSKLNYHNLVAFLEGLEGMDLGDLKSIDQKRSMLI